LPWKLEWVFPPTTPWIVFVVRRERINDDKGFVEFPYFGVGRGER
jgi:hypothetical protein